MKCDEVRERLVDLLYQDKGSPAPDPDLRAHVESCLSCGQEVAELRGVRSKLKEWQDEPPLRKIRIPRVESVRARPAFSWWQLSRYAAFAALLLLAFLGLANADIRWDSSGFSFKTSLFARSASPEQQSPADLVTQEELRESMLRVMTDSRDFTFQTMQRMRDDQDQLWYSTVRMKSARGKN